MVTHVPCNRYPAAGLVGLALALGAHAGRADDRQEARQIIEATGVKGGLIVHLGCGDGRLTAALRAGDRYLVHGLDADAGNIAKAREHIARLGLYGPVAVEHWTGDRLPYADNLVNLLVSADPGKIPMREVTRVLAPRGVAYVKRGDTWSKTIKPAPEDVDEWTHFLHDASGNAVAHDRVVGPPRYAQWIADPRYSRSHEHTPSIQAVVSAGGRLFYIADLAPAASLRQPANWHLVARDAYNGILLWKRAIAPWFSHLSVWTQGPLQLQRRLVAVGDRVYVTLGYHAPLSAVDAATGDTQKVYDETRGTEEVLWHKGVLLVVVRRVTDERVAELASWAELEKKSKSPLHRRESTQPLWKRFRSIEGKAPRALLALDADTGRVRWRKTGSDAAMRELSLCASGDRVFFQQGKDAVCLDLTTGQKLWATPAGRLRVVCDSAVICSGGRTVTALSAENGKALWTQPALLSQIRDAFVINGSLWLGGFKPYDTGRKYTGPAWGPYFVTGRDLATGKVARHIEPENPGHHQRCYPSKATDRYILGGRRGVEFFDLETGDLRWHSWVRGVCRYGVMPANGLLYAPPHACGCYIAAKLTGFNALTHSTVGEKDGPEGQSGDGGERLDRGPAYSDRPRDAQAADMEQQWPTYRHDAQRSGSTPSRAPAALRRRWQADVGGKLTGVTIADGKVFVASVDEHRVCALDADSGRPAWQFTAGARVDSPPTLYRGRAIFGCRDGYVYCLRASDGALAWRLRAARAERRITVSGQLESASPVPGSVLVQDGVVHLTAGRSSYLDGGIDLYRLQPETGNVLSKTPIYSPDPETGKQPKHYGPGAMPGELGAVLSGDGEHVYLRDTVFDKRGVRQPKGAPHLLALTGFLDDTWAHRSYWIFGTRCSISTGCTGREKGLISGRLLALGRRMVYGYGRAKVHWSNQFEDGPYRVFALKRGERTTQWTKPVPVDVRAMVLAGPVLFVAGPPAKAHEGPGAMEDGQPGLLLAVSATDGAELARYPLDSPPVFDGMAAANGRLYLAARDGRVVSLTR